MLQVLFDYGIMFGLAHTNNLIEYWPQINGYPFRSKDIRIDSEKYPVCAKDSDIYDFFTFIKLVATHRVTFHNAVASFIVFSAVSVIIDVIQSMQNMLIFLFSIAGPID